MSFELVTFHPSTTLSESANVETLEMGLLSNLPFHLPHAGSKSAYSASLKSLDEILPPIPHDLSPVFPPCLSQETIMSWLIGWTLQTDSCGSNSSSARY